MIYLKSRDFFLNSRSNITTYLRSPQKPCPEHAHAFEEIIIISQGAGTHVVNDVPMHLSRNYVWYIKKHDRHLFEGVNGLCINNILFKRDELPMSTELKRFMPNPNSPDPGWFIDEKTASYVACLIERLHVEAHRDSDESRILTQALFQQIVIELWRGKITSTHRLSYEDKLTYGLAYIQEHYAVINEIDDVAESLALTSRKLSGGVKKLTGMNFNQYLHHTRMSKAYAEILYSERSITDIALDVGYQDSSYFATKFKQIFKETPSDVRSVPKKPAYP